jgi:hypothetical protein
MHQNAAFPEAENILWDLATSDDIYTEYFRELAEERRLYCLRI